MAHLHCTGQGQGQGQGLGNDGFLYKTMYCTHYTVTGTETGNHFFSIVPVQVPVPILVSCSVYEPLRWQPPTKDGNNSPPEQTDKTGVKTLPCPKLRLQAVIMIKWMNVYVCTCGWGNIVQFRMLHRISTVWLNNNIKLQTKLQLWANLLLERRTQDGRIFLIELDWLLIIVVHWLF